MRKTTREGNRKMGLQLGKAVIRHNLVARGGKVIGVDPQSRRVEYLPAGEEGRKAFECFIDRLYGEFVERERGKCREKAGRF